MTRKSLAFIALGGATLLAAGLAAHASAQARGTARNGGPYEMVLSTVEASGGVSVGGSYELRSAVGQPIVELSNPSTGGDYSLQSGFLAGSRPSEPSAFIVY